MDLLAHLVHEGRVCLKRRGWNKDRAVAEHKVRLLGGFPANVCTCPWPLLQPLFPREEQVARDLVGWVLSAIKASL